MKILVDMNLSPAWVGFLDQHGIEAVHWSEVGDPKAKDAEVMDWARQRGYVVFTHDLGFSALLARAGANGPSVLQMRGQSVEEVLQAYPYLEKEDVHAAFSYAAWRAEEVELPLWPS